MGLDRLRRYAIVRRLLAAASLAGFLAATLGVPVIVPRGGGKDRSQPFPCMNHRCGCANAEQCWQSCCCFTNTQKLAWAAEHGVEPPQYVFAAAAREKPASLTRSCCQLSVKSCCEKDGSCCDEAKHTAHDSHADDEQQEHDVARGHWSLDFVLAVKARRCQGQAELWLALGAVAPPPAKFLPNLQQLVCGTIENFLPALAGTSQSPTTPPPRA
jgi:hypothetical protein